MASSYDRKTRDIHTAREQYYMNDLRSDIKRLKAKKKSNFHQLSGKLQQLNQKVSYLNERVDYLNQKVTQVKVEMTRKIEAIQSRIKRIHKRLFIAIAILSAVAVSMLIAELFILKS